LIVSALRNSPVEGLAMLPGPTEYPIAAGAPLLGPEDWTGKTIQVGATSPVESLTAEALGATPSTDGTGAAADVVSGSVQAATDDPGDLVAAGVAADGPVMTSNVALWPRMTMVLINRDVLDRLSTRQNGFLEGAVVRAKDSAMSTAPDFTTQVADACAAGAVFGTATEEQVEALRTAIAPVYTKLADDPENAKLFAAIQDAVKRHAGTGNLSIPKACRWVAPK
jgi:TRAP-type C4-dicarboxylate transport system substrate-binding protein